MGKPYRAFFFGDEMGILELPDHEFVQVYLKIIETRFPTKSERRRYENIQKYRPRISKQDADVMMARLAVFDRKVRIKRKKGQQLRDIESNQVDWGGIEEKVFESKQTFDVPLLVNGEEKRWPVTAFTMREARIMAIKAAYETGAQYVKLIY